MSNINIEELATVIYEEFLNEGSDDRVFPIVELMTLGYLREQIKTHLENQGHDDLTNFIIDTVTDDIKIIIIRKVEILLNEWKII